MRVLHVISEMGTGGAEALVAAMVDTGADFGWESAVASGGGHRAEALRAGGVPTFDVPVARRTTVGLLRAVFATRGAVRRFRPDVVIAHNVSASVAARLAMVGRRVPLLTVFHGVAETDYRGAARILPRTSDRVVAVASAIAGRLSAAGLAGPAPVVIPNAISPAFAHGDRMAVRTALGVSPQTPVALCLARMEPQKRHDVLLDAWARLEGDAVLWLAGDGSLRGRLRQQCDDLGLGERVRFLGDRSDVPELLAAADVTVLTSDWEGMPIAVLESLAAGRPVVATDVDGVREILADGGGVLVPPAEPARTAVALHTLLSQPEVRIAAGSAGLETVRRRHDPRVLLKSYDELVRTELIGGRR